MKEARRRFEEQYPEDAKKQRWKRDPNNFLRLIPPKGESNK
jgi:hypothetical protein